MLVKFKQNRMVKLHEIWSFLTKQIRFLTIFDKALTTFWKTLL